MARGMIILMEEKLNHIKIIASVACNVWNSEYLPAYWNSY